MHNSRHCESLSFVHRAGCHVGKRGRGMEVPNGEGFSCNSRVVHFLLSPSFLLSRITVVACACLFDLPALSIQGVIVSVLRVMSSLIANSQGGKSGVGHGKRIGMNACLLLNMFLPSVWLTDVYPDLFCLSISLLCSTFHHHHPYHHLSSASPFLYFSYFYSLLLFSSWLSDVCFHNGHVLPRGCIHYGTLCWLSISILSSLLLSLMLCQSAECLVF